MKLKMVKSNNETHQDITSNININNFFDITILLWMFQ
jgi:hypothetical protein